VISTPLKNISQNGNLPQIGVKIKKNVTTTQSTFTQLCTKSPNFVSAPFCTAQKETPNTQNTRVRGDDVFGFP